MRPDEAQIAFLSVSFSLILGLFCCFWQIWDILDGHESLTPFDFSFKPPLEDLGTTAGDRSDHRTTTFAGLLECDSTGNKVSKF